jgi:hypothetical protein
MIHIIKSGQEGGLSGGVHSRMTRKSKRGGQIRFIDRFH